MGIRDVVARTTTVFEPQRDDIPPATLREVLATLGPMVLAHVAVPIDLVPDFVPVLGYADEPSSSPSCSARS